LHCYGKLREIKQVEDGSGMVTIPIVEKRCGDNTNRREISGKWRVLELVSAGELGDLSLESRLRHGNEVTGVSLGE
jgi:hypothetical protein